MLLPKNNIPKWRYYLPSLRFSVSLPLIKIETTFMYERPDMWGIEWYGLNINIWKYHFCFNLYWKPYY